MVVEILHQTYQRDRVAHGIVDYLSARPKSQRMTIVDRSIVHLKIAGIKARKTEVLNAFRALEAAGCGKLVIGRNHEKTRFIWTVPTKGLASSAAREVVRPAPHNLGHQEIEVANIKLVLPSHMEGEHIKRLIEAVRQALSGDENA